MPFFSSRPTQDFVPIREIRDGVIVLKDGGMRAVLISTSLNFGLKSQDEQHSIIFQFQNFLNSLDFSLQIFIESRRLDIQPYLAILEERHKAQLSELMKIQTREYIEFIKTFSENTNIMKKSFFIIVPFNVSSVSSSANPIKSIFGKKESAADKLASFEEKKVQLMQRVSVIEQGASRMGLRTNLLQTEEVIELFYKIFNPDQTETAIQDK